MDIAFMADKGGVGKTTLAYHTAARFSQLGYDVGLIDMDGRTACVHWARIADGPDFPVYNVAGNKVQMPKHDVRIWDTPAHPRRDVQRDLTDACDLVLVVSDDDFESQVAALELSGSLQGRGEVRIVFNNVHPRSRFALDSIDLVRRRGRAALDAYVRHYACFKQCRWDGRTVADYAYPSADKAWGDICDMVDAVLELLEVKDAQGAA